MKKIILALMAGILLIGTNLYAAGNLYVEGNVGIGTSTPTEKLHVYAVNESKGLLVDLNLSSAPAVTNMGARFNVDVSETGLASMTRYIGLQGQVIVSGSGTIIDMIGTEGGIAFGTGAGPVTVSKAIGGSFALSSSSLNTEPITLTDYYGVHLYGTNAGSGAIGGTNWRHAYFEDFPDYGGTIENMAALWIDQQTRGTKNYGIVLNGDGYGADIVFGPNQEASIYSDAGELYVQDGSSNITQISPHDPKTGEWIFYSKNVKTGRVVRVNMEELVRDMEKLTGKKYLIETFVESK